MRFELSYKVNYNRSTKVRSVTVQGHNPIYIIRVTPPGLSRVYYQVRCINTGKSSRYFSTVRDAIFYIIQGM
jgi:hypothetical protein